MVIKNVDSDKVAKAILVSKNNRFLIMRVSENVKHLGQWDLPGGHLIIGEDPLDGLIRETYEETGLIVKNAKKLFAQDETTYYKAPLPQGKIKLSSEHDKYKFIMLSEIDDYEISQKFKEAIRRVYE